MSAIDLKPCPFCGHTEPHIERMGNSRVSTQYQCGMCCCYLETGEEWDHGTRWNQRPAEDMLAAMIALRESEIDDLRAIIKQRGEVTDMEAALLFQAECIVGLNAKIDTLRSALEEIECGDGCRSGYGGCDSKCRDVARIALGATA